MNQIIFLGKNIYQHRDHSDFNCQRLLTFWIRGLFNGSEVMALRNFFLQDPILKEIEQGNAIFYEQMTRHVFYHQSTLPERARLIKDHFRICRQNFYFWALEHLYYDKRLVLWESPFENSLLSLGLDFQYVDRKEGLLSVDLMLGEKRIYHITFWGGYDRDGCCCLNIGALQGSLNGQDDIHALTKHFFGYRPKNLILYALRLLSPALGAQKIYAVSNHGFFTNTHVRLDRKLKTSLDEFWLEAGGDPLDDPRFFELPVNEKRKAIEEVKSQKRNLYRKRYAALDEIAAEFKTSLRHYLKPQKKASLPEEPAVAATFFEN